MEFQDYYKTLGISRSATLDDIKKSYRKLARKYHPDVSKEANAEENFKKVKEAYEVLKDPEKRKAYDQFGEHWKQGQSFKAPPEWGYHEAKGSGGDFKDFQEFNMGGAGEFSDFFESLFRAKGGRRTGFKQRGNDEQSKINITLEEAYKGSTRLLTLQTPEVNPKTHQVSYKTRELKVKIPAGVTDGQQIRLAGLGSPGIGGGPNGDLYLEIHIEPHRLFTLTGKDIYLTLPLTPWEAALGASIAVPTLGGSVNLKIPPGSQTGQQLRLKGRGLTSTAPGDQYVTLKVYIPKAESSEQKKLYQQMAELMPFNPRSEW